MFKNFYFLFWILLSFTATSGFGPQNPKNWCVIVGSAYFDDQPTMMTKELPAYGRVQAQCASTCWLYAEHTATEIRMSTKKGESIELSSNYSVATNLSLAIVDSIIQGRFKESFFDAGGWAENYRRAAMHRGVRPRDSQEQDISAATWRTIETEAWTIGDHYRRLYKAASNESKQAILKRAENELFLLITKKGNISTGNIQFGDSTLTPLDFYRQYDIKHDRPFVTIASTFVPNNFTSNFDAAPFPKVVAQNENKVENLELIKQRINHGVPVLVSFNSWRPTFENLKRAGYLGANQNGPSSKETAAHLIVLVGYKEKDGNIVAFKFRNTWGKERGNNGDFYMSAETFKLAANSIYE